MENLKIIVSGTFKEKAMLLSVIGDALEAKGIKVKYKEKSFDTLVRDHCGDVCEEQIKELKPNIILELENLRNTNLVEDLTKLNSDFKTLKWESIDLGWNRAISVVSNELDQLLLT